MARGGARPGSGRPKGSKNKATQKRKEIAENLLKKGKTPLEVILDMMRGRRKFNRDILEAAKAAAPFVHPRLNAIDFTGDVTLHHEDWLEQLPEDTDE